jgi:hypothetical protein
VVEDVAVEDELADVAVIICAGVNLIALLDEDGVFEDVIQAAILVLKLIGVVAKCSNDPER